HRLALITILAALLASCGKDSDTPAQNPPKAPAPATSTGAMKSFTNVRTGFSGPRLDHYTDFSFSYPDSWKLDSGQADPSAPLFVEVNHLIPFHREPFITD